MSTFQFVLPATKAHTGALIKKMFLSAPAYMFYGIFMLGCILIAHASSNASPIIVGIMLVGGILHIVQQFLKNVLFANKNTESKNIADLLSADIVQKLAYKEKKNTLSLFESALYTEGGSFILTEMGIDAKSMIEKCAKDTPHIDCLEFLLQAKDLQAEFDEALITAPLLIFLGMQYIGGLKELLNELDLSQEDILHILEWERMHRRWQDEVYAWSPRKLVQTCGTIGRGWVLGYTEGLDAYTTDLSEKILRNSERKIQLHEKELVQAAHILSRATDQNVLILGQVGVGKATFVENLAYLLRKNEVEHSLPFTRVLIVHSAQLLSGTQKPDAVLLDALNHAAKAGKFILVIDNLSLLVHSGNKEMISVISQFLQSPAMSLIALAEPQEYHVLVKNDPALDHLFEKIFLQEPNDNDTLKVMMTHYFTLEHKGKVHITYRALRSIFNLSDRYIGSISFPGKALSIMDDAVLRARKNGRKIVHEQDVQEMVSMKARIDVQSVSEKEKDRLLHLEEVMKKEIIGQDKAVVAISNALKRARMDIHATEKPLGTFLFLGPTGVGKTQTAKTIARHYFGNQKNIIRLDMNEYSSEDSIKLIVGSPEVGDDLSEGFLARSVQEKPFSLILLDEIEKAHPNVLNIFLQILDEGQLTDGLGVKTDFKNAIIIATSNAGALFIRDAIQKHSSDNHKVLKKDLINELIEKKTFSPEFINRFDDIIVYNPLSIENAKRIAIIMLDDIIEDMRNKKGVLLKLEEGVLDTIIQHGYSQEFGARQMHRAIVDMVETYLADYFLKNDVKRGEEILITKEEIE